MTLDCTLILRILQAKPCKIVLVIYVILMILFQPMFSLYLKLVRHQQEQEHICYDEKTFEQVSCTERRKRDTTNLYEVELVEETEQDFEYPGLSYHIGVLSSWKFRSTRISALYHTWGKEAANISFYVGEPDKKYAYDKYLPIRVLTEVEDTVYPPQRKAFEMLQYWCDNLLQDFQWFIRADDDIYMKIFQLERFLYSLDHNKTYYIGRSGEGLPRERASLGLRGNKFCCGPTVIYSRPTLEALCPHIEACSKSTVSSHEDTEVGRCVMQNVHIQCATNTGYPTLNELFFHQYSFKEPELLHGDLSVSAFFLKAISIHEVKDGAVMYNLAFSDLSTRGAITKFKKPMKHKSNPLKIVQLPAFPMKVEKKQNATSKQQTKVDSANIDKT